MSENEDLDQKLNRWKRALRDAATGPLVVACEVRDVAKRWQQHKDDAGGIECTSWLAEKLGTGRNLAFFLRRAQAVDKLGEACRRYMHHEVAVWLSRKTLEVQKLTKIKRALYAGCKDNGDNPLTLYQAKPVANDILGHVRKPKENLQALVAELRARIRELERELAEARRAS